MLSGQTHIIANYRDSVMPVHIIPTGNSSKLYCKTFLSFTSHFNRFKEHVPLICGSQI